MAEDGPASDNLVQRLMTAEEVYVYKIPPMKTATGHRAEDWNLAKPLQTCKLIVERRGDALWMDFMNKDAIFAQSKIDLVEGKTIASYFEQVTDSSRYFVLKIQGAGGREAMIGFGFRERENAVDLREALQHYERAIARETNPGASLSGSYSIPQMKDGEKIHVKTGSGKSKPKKSEGGSGGALLKKPPPPAGEEEAAAPAEKTVEKVAIQMGDIDLDAGKSKKEAEDDDSGEAVYEGDEEQWATEFAMK